jgi:RNA polymerase sigma-70 factor (ECF subfamily)
MEYELLADEKLLELLKADDKSAFKEIYRRYWEGLYHMALRKINSKEVAEDIVQTVLVDLWDRRINHNIQNINSYLKASVKYQVINYIKAAISKKIHLSAFGERQGTEQNDGDLLLLTRELNTAINRAIRQLPQKTQTIFRLSRFERHSNKDISRIMDLSEKAVEYHITQSLKTLRLHLKDFMISIAMICFF